MKKQLKTLAPAVDSGVILFKKNLLNRLKIKLNTSDFSAFWHYQPLYAIQMYLLWVAFVALASIVGIMVRAAWWFIDELKSDGVILPDAATCGEASKTEHEKDGTQTMKDNNLETELKSHNEKPPALSEKLKLAWKDSYFIVIWQNCGILGKITIFPALSVIGLFVWIVYKVFSAAPVKKAVKFVWSLFITDGK